MNIRSERPYWLVFAVSCVIALALAIFLTSCGSITQTLGPWSVRQCGPTFIVYSKNMPDESVEQLTQAFSYWNRLLGMSIWYDGGPIGDELEPAEGYVVVDRGILPGSICGDTPYSVGPTGCIGAAHVTLSETCEENTTEAAWQSMVRHELGHALGLRHNGGKGHLMQASLPPYGDEPLGLDAEETAAVRAVYGSVR